MLTLGPDLHLVSDCLYHFNTHCEINIMPNITVGGACIWVRISTNENTHILIHIDKLKERRVQESWTSLNVFLSKRVSEQMDLILSFSSFSNLFSSSLHSSTIPSLMPLQHPHIHINTITAIITHNDRSKLEETKIFSVFLQNICIDLQPSHRISV